jgi:hypothetical protein
MSDLLNVSRALTVAASAVLPAVVARAASHIVADYPTLHGDGVTNDYPALKALFERRPIWCEGEVICATEGDIDVPSGRFAISQKIVLENLYDVNISNIHLIALPEMQEPCMISFVNCKVNVGNLHLYGGGIHFNTGSSLSISEDLNHV